MNRPWKVVAAFIGVFIAGSIFGGLLAPRLDFRRHGIVQRGGAGDAPLLPQLMQRFAARLDLTPEQREQLRPVMERAGEDLRRLRQTGFRETGVVLERLQQDVAKVLTPEQRLKLDVLRQEQRERLRRERDRGGNLERRGHPGGGGMPERPMRPSPDAP